MKATSSKPVASREPEIIDAEFREVVPLSQRIQPHRRTVEGLGFVALAFIALCGALGVLSGPATWAAIVGGGALIGAALHINKGGRHA